MYTRGFLLELWLLTRGHGVSIPKSGAPAQNSLQILGAEVSCDPMTKTKVEMQILYYSFRCSRLWRTLLPSFLLLLSIFHPVIPAVYLWDSRAWHYNYILLSDCILSFFSFSLKKSHKIENQHLANNYLNHSSKNTVCCFFSCVYYNGLAKKFVQG